MDIVKIAYLAKWYSLKVRNKLIGNSKNSRNHYAGKPIMSIDNANAAIAEAISEKKPFMAGRFGASELNVIWRASGNNKSWDINPDSTILQLHDWSGFFPASREAALKFSTIMKEAAGQVDLLATWFNTMEDYAIKEWCSEGVKLCTLRGIEPFFAEMPWTLALEGKKVLVIHPFVETISDQYQKREALFIKPILPEFTLIAQRAVQTIAGNKDERFQTWFDALDYMVEKAMRVDFDVAILGCGAYGFPLAARLKSEGKAAIHLGGSAQLLFGIRGTRWDEKPDYQPLFTDAWVRPSQNEIPSNAKKVENGCYW